MAKLTLNICRTPLAHLQFIQNNRTIFDFSITLFFRYCRAAKKAHTDVPCTPQQHVKMSESFDEWSVA